MRSKAHKEEEIEKRVFACVKERERERERKRERERENKRNEIVESKSSKIRE